MKRLIKLIFQFLETGIESHKQELIANKVAEKAFQLSIQNHENGLITHSFNYMVELSKVESRLEYLKSIEILSNEQNSEKVYLEKIKDELLNILIKSNNKL